MATEVNLSVNDCLSLWISDSDRLASITPMTGWTGSKKTDREDRENKRKTYCLYPKHKDRK